MANNLSPALSDEWITWLRDVVVAAHHLIAEDAISASSEEERELLALKAALYARALTIFEGSLLLIENDRQLDFRIHSRGVIEASIYLIALDSNPAVVTKMKDDDFRSRQSRAGLHLNAQDRNVTPEAQKMLEDFVAQGPQGTKAIQIGKLLEGNGFDRLYRSYRDISGDAAHVSMTALDRHYVENPMDQAAMLIVHPALDDIDLYVTVAELGISMIIATLVLMKVKQHSNAWEEFQSLLRRYRELSSDKQLHQGTDSPSHVN